MLTKTSYSFSALRLALLALVLMLTFVAMISPAAAACTYGQTRTVVVNIECCAYPLVYATLQHQVCCAGGVWMNDGSPYCGKWSVCAF